MLFLAAKVTSKTYLKSLSINLAVTTAAPKTNLVE